MNADLKFYFAVFIRRLHYFLAVFVLVTAVSLTVARILPPVYESETRLLVEGSQIPVELAAPTVRTGASEGLEIIEQRLMTRVNLLAIARAQNVFDDIAVLPADTIVQRMRDNTKIRRSAGRGRATLMRISFSADNGSVAAAVINQYVTLILQDNVEIRTDRAGDTLQFFETEVERLGGDLEAQSARILNFKGRNTGALPDSLEYRLNQQSVLQERAASVEREAVSLREQKRRLIEIFDATGRITGVAQNNLTPEQAQLARLENELRRSLAIYSPENPKIKIIQAQIAQQESLVASASGIDPADSQSQATLMDIQLAAIDSRVDLLGEQRTRLEAQLVALLDSIQRTPANSIMLQSFDRDYQNIQQQYNTAVDRLAKAATGERIELLSKGQRIAILDPATAPSAPTSPNRALISIGGTVGGALLGLGLVVLLEILNASIRRPADITRRMGITPLATVPYIRTPMELVVRRAVFVLVFSVLAIGLPAALYVVHTYYLPLDLIYDRIAGKIGAVL